MEIYIIKLLFLLLFSSILSEGLDIFCGEMEIYEQQRFGKDSLALASQQTNDLKQCLELCCGIPNCDGVSFTGFIFEQTTQPNCLFINCRRQCQLNPKGEYNEADGVVSVILRRHTTSNETLQIPDIVTDQTINPPSTPGSPSMLPEAPWNSPPATTTDWAGYSTPAVAEAGPTVTLAPVWVVGLAIVIAVVCIGLNLSLLSAYVCYKRKQSKRRKAQITSNKGPTLHAFNPTI